MYDGCTLEVNMTIKKKDSFFIDHNLQSATTVLCIIKLCS